LSLRSYVLTIRKEEASKIELKEVTCIWTMFLP
jgi:Fe2+ transport system protein FeoA